MLSSCSQTDLKNTIPEPAYQQRVLTSEGRSEIVNQATLSARKQAFNAAVRNAARQAGIKDSLQFILAGSKVVDEWIEQGYYHVQLLTVISDDLRCQSPYRKRILATGFPIVTPGQINANESQDIYAGIPREIMNILMESGDFIGRNQTHLKIYQKPERAPEFSEGEQARLIIRLAEKNQAQYVLSGVIRDLKVESSEYTRGAGVFSQAKAIMRDFVSRRSVGIDIYVHDGVSGALLFQQRYSGSVVGDVWVPYGYTVGSERFKSTPLGNKVSDIIQQASKDIQGLFACYPFMARVTKIKGKRVYLDAGAQQKLKPGDMLSIYSVQQADDFSEQTLIGVVRITDVQAKHAVAEMEVVSDLRRLRIGDLVKSW